MKGFCISLDVSKGSSFYQGFKGIDEPITKPKKIEHNLEGFKELLNLKEKIRKEYDEDCIVVFESTGVYHRSLQTYLDEHDFKYTIISPLLSAKVRKSDISNLSKIKHLKDILHNNICRILIVVVGTNIGVINSKRRSAIDRLCEITGIDKDELPRKRKSGRKTNLPINNNKK